MNNIEIASRDLGKTYTEAAIAKSPDIKRIVREIVELTPIPYRAAICEVAQNIYYHCASHTSEIPDNIYRLFDDFDQILGIDYRQENRVMPSASVRDYAGSGVGVQSSYASVICLLEKIQAKQNASFVDLGSGYGRVGLLLGVLRSDIDFVGYEFVGERVRSSNASSLRAGIETRVRFIEQDLANENFKIPVADFYYLYDPFTPETYRSVIEQIKVVGSQKKITVITKGNAGVWLSDALSGLNWTTETFDIGHMKLFSS